MKRDANALWFVLGFLIAMLVVSTLAKPSQVVVDSIVPGVWATDVESDTLNADSWRFVDEHLIVIRGSKFIASYDQRFVRRVRRVAP